MKRFIFLALLSAYLAHPGQASAQLIPDKATMQKIAKDLIPDKIQGSALMNVTMVRQGRWRIGPIRNAILTRRRGPAPPLFGRTRTLIMDANVYPGAAPQAPRRPGTTSMMGGVGRSC